VAERYWTPDEANASLDRVGGLVARAQHLAAEMQAKAEPMASRANGNGRRSTADPRSELTQVLEGLDADGIALRDIERGLVDFSARTSGGREYWLCWLVGEPEVAWWHWPEDGFGGRTPVERLPD
jgi:hypothetical protein